MIKTTWQSHNSRHLRRDYAPKKLNNPFIKNKSLSKDFGRVLKFSCVGVLILVLLIIWVVWASPLFRIKNIKISGLSRVSQDSVESVIRDQESRRRLLFFRQSNLWLFRKDDLIKSLSQEYNFSEIKISRRIFKTLNISVTEREIAYIWLENNTYQYVDQAGYVIKELPIIISAEIVEPQISSSSPNSSSTWPLALEQIKKDNNYHYPIIVNNTTRLINEQKVGWVEELVLVDKVFKKLVANNDSELKAQVFLLDDELGTLKMLLSGGPQVYFNTRGDIEKQVNYLLAVKKDLKQDFYKKIKYKIDLRYDNQIIYQ